MLNANGIESACGNLDLFVADRAYIDGSKLVDVEHPILRIRSVVEEVMHQRILDGHTVVRQALEGGDEIFVIDRATGLVGVPVETDISEYLVTG